MEDVRLFIKNSSDEELNVFASNIDAQMCKCVSSDRIKWRKLYELSELVRVEINLRVKETPLAEWRALLYHNI